MKRSRRSPTTKIWSEKIWNILEAYLNAYGGSRQPPPPNFDPG